MTNLRLSEHFTLAEFERSATAEKYHIDNSVPPQYVPVLQQLCKEVLEPTITLWFVSETSLRLQ